MFFFHSFRIENFITQFTRPRFFLLVLFSFTLLFIVIFCRNSTCSICCFFIIFVCLLITNILIILIICLFLVFSWNKIQLHKIYFISFFNHMSFNQLKAKTLVETFAAWVWWHGRHFKKQIFKFTCFKQVVVHTGTQANILIVIADSYTIEIFVGGIRIVF